MRYPTLHAGTMRHTDHRFEWTRAQGEAVGGAGVRDVRVHVPGGGRRGRRPGGRAADAAARLHAGRRPHERAGDPGAGAGRAGRGVGVGQVDVRRASGSGGTRWCPATSAAAWSSDDETDQDATKDAFEVLSFVVGKRLDRGPPHGGRRDERAARRPQARGGAGPGARRAAGRDRAGPAGGRVPGAQPRARRPGAAGARGDAAARPGPARGRWAGARGVPAGARAAHGRGGGAGDDRPRRACATTCATSTVRSTSSATCTAAASELETLLERLGYALVRDDAGRPVDAVHPEGRKVVFLGDLVDRGPDTPGVLRLAMGMTAAGHALAVPGNHEHKLVRALDGRKVHGQPRAGDVAGAAGRGGPGVLARRSGRGPTGWSRTWCSTTGGWSSRTPG